MVVACGQKTGGQACCAGGERGWVVVVMSVHARMWEGR